MTCILVKDAIAELQRYNPDVKLSSELEIDSISPATTCNVSIFNSADEKYQKEIEGENKEMEASLGRLEQVIDDMRDACREKEWVKIRDLIEKAGNEF